MTLKPLLLAALAASLLAGCANRETRGLGPDVTAGAGAGGFAAGPAADPSSPAFFAASVGDRVLFTVDQSTLDDEARATLVAQADWLATNPEYTAVIEGHADEQGTREYNLALGARRAAAAEEFLVSRGVAPTRLRTVSFGKERPLAVCSDETCYRQNRRAVTVLAAGPGAGV